MKAKGCLVFAAVVLGLVTVFAAVVGPTLVREGTRLYQPIAKIKGAQIEFDAWSDTHAFKAPPGISFSAEQLDRFLKLRRRLDAVEEKNPFPVDQMGRDERPKLSDIEGLLSGVGGAVTGQMAAYREIGMPPDEYRYLEKAIYRTWLRPLRAKGVDPAAVARAGMELGDLAKTEKDAAVRNRLISLASSLAGRRVPVPDGFPPEIHALLLTRAIEIDALVDAGPLIPMRRSRMSF